MAKKDKNLIITVDGKQYFFNSIVQRTIHAPVNKINVEKLMHCKPTGIEAIDNSELRVCRINKEWKILSGFSKVTATVEAVLKSKERGDPIEEGATPPDVIVAKIMSLTYLESTAVPPTKESMASRLQQAGFKVR